MKSKKAILPLFLFFVLAIAKGQDARLLEYSKVLDQKYTIEQVKTQKRAYSLGIPMRTLIGDNTIQLSRFVNGFPRFITTSNANAAATTSTSAVWPGGAAGLNLTGTGITLGLWDEGRARPTHQEFGGRVVIGDAVSSNAGHSTHVAGTMIGSGTINPAAKGMSFHASLRSYDWNNDISEMAAAAATWLQVSNHSYTYLTGWYKYDNANNGWIWYGDTTYSRTTDYGFGAYDQEAYSWDTVAWMAPRYLIIKSSDNNRFEGPASQPLQHYIWNGTAYVLTSTVRDKDGGTSGYDCIPWQANAKNILTVGAVNDIPGGYQLPSQVVLAGFSGCGPADDGRIKPDIVANGTSLYSTYYSSDTSHAAMSGTSMATPNTSGSIGLLLEHQRNLTGSATIRSATIKGLIIHTTDEAGTANGPDYNFGWGLLNVKKAAVMMSENATNGFNFNIRELTLSQGDTIRIPVFTNGTQPLVATACWTDRPSHIFTAFANDTTHMLVNDLDLRMISSTSSTYYPWKLKGGTPALAATKGDNSVDNVEKIEAGTPVANQIWYVQITHKGTLVGGNQDFSLLVSGITKRTLNIQVLLEGLYAGQGVMRQAYDGSAPHFGTGIADQITVELHSATNYNQIMYTFNGVDLHTNGQASIPLPATITGSYYITVKHRNSIEITTTNTVSFSNATISYAFDSPSKAFGNNLKLLTTGMYGIYAGNVNSDGIIDQTDMNNIQTDASICATGFLVTDLNGDGAVDTQDLIMGDNNASNFVTAKKP